MEMMTQSENAQYEQHQSIRQSDEVPWIWDEISSQSNICLRELFKFTILTYFSQVFKWFTEIKKAAVLYKT